MSESIGELVKALTKAKETIKAPKKAKTAEIPTKSGGKFSYSYADRADVIEAYGKALGDNGLAIVHTVTVDANLHTVLVSRLVHTSGQEIASSIPIPSVHDAQALGSWLTYLERYQSCALLDLAAEDDSDGQFAVSARGKKEEKRPEPKPEPPKAPEGPLVTEEQSEAIRHAAKEAGVKTMGEFKAALLRFAGTEIAGHVPADKLEHVLEQFELMKAPA